jgi:tRNA G18 (ribose-2'-O)-methylase SpoU
MRGYFGIGVFHSKRAENIGTLMRSAWAFNAAFVFTIGRRYARQSSDTVDATKHVPLYHYADLAEFLATRPVDAMLVGVECGVDAIPLTQFQHPERAIYLLGAEDHGLNAAAVAACERVVVIEGARMCLNVATAGTVVLHHRTAQRARGQRLSTVVGGAA